MDFQLCSVGPIDFQIDTLFLYLITYTDSIYLRFTIECGNGYLTIKQYKNIFISTLHFVLDSLLLRRYLPNNLSNKREIDLLLR